MPRIVATSTGAAIRIGTYGVATTRNAVEVPDRVAAELAGRSDLRVQKPPAAAKTTPVSAGEGEGTGDAERKPRRRRE